MNIVIYLMVAVIIGWVATKFMCDPSMLRFNILGAVLGALLTGYLFSPLFKVSAITETINTPTMLVTLLGSIILVGVVNFIPSGPGPMQSDNLT